MLIGIIIVSYHNEEGTVRYILQELPKLTDNFRVIVVAVDADTTQAQYIADKCGLSQADGNILPDNALGWVTSSTDNLGYAKGNNLGVKTLQQTGLNFDYYLFSNDDISLVNSNILSRLAQCIESDEKCGGAGPRVVSLDGIDQSPHRKYISPIRLIGWRLLPFLRKKKVASTDTNADETVKEIAQYKSRSLDVSRVLATSAPVPPERGECYWVSGAFMMVKSELFNQVGGFDSRTFLYYEEVILSERFRHAGMKFRYEPSACVIHYEGGSTDVKSRTRNDIEMQSRLLYFREYMHVNPFILWLYKLICS